MDATVPPASFSADLSDCDLLSTLTADEIVNIFISALARAGATIVEVVSHAFPERGLTCVLILSESHAALHTWPETGTVNIDIFSCSTRLKSLEAIHDLRRSLGAQHAAVQEIARVDGHGPGSQRHR